MLADLSHTHMLSSPFSTCGEGDLRKLDVELDRERMDFLSNKEA
jgi:hypothetical protein